MKNLSRDEAAERAALLRVESYEVWLDLTAAPSATRFGAGTRVVFECRRDGADTFVEHAVPVWESAVLDGVPLDVGTVAGNRLPLRGLSAGRHELEVRAVADYSVPLDADQPGLVMAGTIITASVTAASWLVYGQLLVRALAVGRRAA